MNAMPQLKDQTLEDLRALVLPEGHKAELIDGVIYAQASPVLRHQAAASAIHRKIGNAYYGKKGGPEGPGGWWIFYEFEAHLARNVFIPDLMGWRHVRLPELPDTSYIDLAPDWVCEVVSPGSASRDRFLKSVHYARAGINHYWIVDPIAKTLEVLVLEGDRYMLLHSAREDEVVRCEPFEALELNLAELWV